MRIELTKLSNERHRLDVVRDDGSRDGAELESRSLLLHDLVHYAVEAEAGITDGFWGLLAAGHDLRALSEATMDAPLGPGIALAEHLVGPMQSLWNGRLDEARYLEMGARIAPDIVDASFVARTRERLRQLQGHWRATAYRQRMPLEWPPRPVEA